MKKEDLAESSVLPLICYLTYVSTSKFLGICCLNQYGTDDVTRCHFHLISGKERYRKDLSKLLRQFCVLHWEEIMTEIPNCVGCVSAELVIIITQDL